MITPSGLTVAVRRARRTTAAGEGLRAVRGRLRARGLAGADLCQPLSLTALRQPWRDLAAGDIDLTVLARALDPASPAEVGQGTSRKPDPRGSNAGAASAREALSDGGLRQRPWSGPGSRVVRNDPASGESALTSNRLVPGDRSELLARRGSWLPDDLPEALVTSDAVGHSTQGSDVATRPDTGVAGDRPDLGRDYVGQSGLGELLRRWDNVHPEDTATTFPGARPIPMRRHGATPPEGASGAIPPDPTPPNAGRPEAGSPNATPFDATPPGVTPLDATPFDAAPPGVTPLDATPLDAARPGATPFDATSLAATPFDAIQPGATPFGANPLGGTRPGATPAGARRPGAGPVLSGPDRAVHSWPPAALAPADLLGDLEDVVEEALEALVLREAERYGLDAGAP